MTDHNEALKKATAAYRRANKRATDIQKKASAELAAAMRAAFTEGHMRKADILKATDHIWSRTWLDKAIAEDQTKQAKD